MIAISDLNQRGDRPVKDNLRIVWKVIKYDRNDVMHADWKNSNTVTHRASKAMLADNNQCTLILRQTHKHLRDERFAAQHQEIV